MFDKDKRHQFYNEFDMISLIKSNCPTLVSCISLINDWMKVQYYGVYYDQGLIHLIMEYMDGGSLETMVAVEKKYYTPEK